MFNVIKLSKFLVNETILKQFINQVNINIKNLFYNTYKISIFLL